MVCWTVYSENKWKTREDDIKNVDDVFLFNNLIHENPDWKV